MSTVVWGVMSAGLAVLAVGLMLVWGRFRSAAGAAKVLVLAPVFEAAALAAFAAEHFLLSRGLMTIVPRWLPDPLFWTYFVGAALLAAAISLLAWRQVRWSAPLLALLFLIIVATIDVPNLPPHAHERLFWTLTFRELCFASGAMVLTGSLWPRTNPVGATLMLIGRLIVALTFVFYAVEHFLFPRFVPGVPLEKLTPSWFPAPVVLSYFVGIVLLLGGVGLLIRRTVRIAATSVGIVLLALTAFFYVPIMVTEFHSQLALEGVNYVFDTLLFAATALLAGFGVEETAV
ncbi:MAG: hypothetical protein WA510_01530 [Acidobacteriaceae bacterium]